VVLSGVKIGFGRLLRALQDVDFAQSAVAIFGLNVPHAILLDRRNKWIHLHSQFH
jgi:hypothetical protein